ncbi:MAG: PAS domain S-box protein [Oligoflexus sp.]|nr:PAS domain S-box protein [Oligoflexus sp.]
MSVERSLVENSLTEGQSLTSLIQNFSHIFDNCKDVMNIFSLTDNLILSVNRAGFESTGYTLHELQELPIDRLYPPEEQTKLFKSFQRLETEGSAQEKLKMYVKNGELRDLWLRSFIVQTSPKMLALVHTIDITEETRREQKALTDSRLASLGETSAMLAHELTNAVAAIHAGIYLLEMDRANIFSATGLQRLERVKSSVKHMENIISSIQRYGRVAKSSSAFNSLPNLVSEASNLLGGFLHAKGITLISDFAPDAPLVWTNAVEIEQILLILMKNAAQAMESSPTRTITLKSRVVEGGVDLTVTDSGTGIDEAVRGRIFASFISTKPVGVGAGLGLSIAKRLADSNRVSLTFSSISGEGTTFTLGFRADDNAAYSQKNRDEVKAYAGKKILLVGDGEEFIGKIHSFLLSKGAEIIRATSGQEALKVLAVEHLDVIICDENLYPLDEFTFISQARLVFGGVILALCSQRKAALLSLEESSTVDYILQKPFDMQLLDELLQSTERIS